MRIGIVADVHGNAAGLATALERLDGVDELVCAGDVVEEFRFSNEAVSMLRARGARCVLGNHDVGLLGPQGARARSAPDVHPELVAWLASQPTTIETVVAGKKLVVTHASPCPPYTQYVLPYSRELRRIAAVDADIVVLGHTHKQMVQRAGRAVVINPGSVGQARDPGNGKRLSYAVLELSTGDASVDDVEISDFDAAP